MERKRWKRIGLLLLICILVIGSVGCGGKKTPPKQSEKPEEEPMGPYNWPKSEIAKLIPEPESHVGRIEWEASNGFVVYVGEISKEQYTAYVDACWEKGFTEDYRRGDDFFWADNADGYKLTLRYKENNVMSIRMDEPDKKDMGSPVEPTEEPVIGEDPAPAEIPAASDTPEQSQEPQKNTASDGYGVGETARLGDVCATLEKVEESKGTVYLKPESGNVFLICHFNIENNSKEDLGISSIMSFDAYVDDYSVSLSLSAMGSSKKKQLDGSVAAGKKMSGVVGYEAPADWKELEISFKPNVWTGGEMTFVAAK